MADPAEAALAYVETHRVMTLATTGADGPWAAAVFYASDAFTLYFLSAEETRHARNIAVTGRCAAAIQEDYADWAAIKGIQLEGMVQRLEGSERQDAIKCYTEKFPFLINAPQPVARALEKVAWYRLTPKRLYFIDNSRGFASREQIL